LRCEGWQQSFSFYLRKCWSLKNVRGGERERGETWRGERGRKRRLGENKSVRVRNKERD